MRAFFSIIGSLYHKSASLQPARDPGRYIGVDLRRGDTGRGGKIERVIASLNDGKITGGGQALQNRPEFRHIAQGVPRPGEKQHRDTYSVKVVIPELLRLSGRMEGITEKDEPPYLQTSGSDQVGGDASAQGFPGGDDAVRIATGLICKAFPSLDPCLFQYFPPVRGVKAFFPIGKIETGGNMAGPGKSMGCGHQQGMVHVVPGPVGNDYPGPLTDRIRLRERKGKGYQIMIIDMNKRLSAHVRFNRCFLSLPRLMPHAVPPVNRKSA